jgi:NADH-quinone oxidoreductase subunit E
MNEAEGAAVSRRAGSPSKEHAGMAGHRKFDFRKLQYAGESGTLIPALQRAQSQDGYISPERMLEIHRRSGIPLSQIYGVATFYSQFRLRPVGRNIIRVCHGTACHVSGANAITKAAEDYLKIATGDTTSDRLFTLETVSCVGCCSLAPVIMINHATWGNLEPPDVKKILRKHKQGGDGGAES